MSLGAGPFVGRELASERTHERARAFDARAAARYQTNGRAAPALITARRRRRSYFTPRSSIIHAVNNAPLFRVTLYREVSFPPLPSFPPSAPSPSPGVAAEGLPKVSPPTTRPGCVLYPVRTLLSPGLSSETETRGLRSLARSLARHTPFLRGGRFMSLGIAGGIGMMTKGPYRIRLRSTTNKARARFF